MMPVYEYRCSHCGTAFDKFLPLARYSEAQMCECGQVAEKQISAPAVFGDFPGYECPVTGDWIEGKRAHERNLEKTGCRVLESGETEQAARRRAEADAALENSVAETAAKFVATLPAAKKEQLAGELSSGADVAVTRLST